MMRAALYHGPGDIRLDNVPEPNPGPDDVKVRTLHNGLCGTDLHQYFVGPMSPAPLPVVVGHEFAGEVVEVGRNVTRVAVGDVVAVEPLWPCGACPPCEAGDYNLCVQILCHGLGGPGGGLSEFTIVRERMAYRLPEQVGPVLGALVEPMSVAYRAVLRAHPLPGVAAVVLGGGPIGIGSLLALRALGVEDVTVVEPAAQRRAAVSALGAETVLDPSATDVVGAIREATHGAGVPVVIDAAGVAASFTAGLGVASTKARFVTVAAYMEPVTYNPTDAMMREIEIVSSFSYAGEFDAVIGHMAAGRYPTEGWIEHVPFDDHLGAYDRLHRGEAIKLLVDL
jgi:(R,R)-butanediol dehydrogenase/meso-butanediol dehydrogenase/diacetyl reductase